MQVNRESNLIINTSLEPVSNNGLVTPLSPLEKAEKNEELKQSEKSEKRFLRQSFDNGLSDEKMLQNELHTGSVDLEDTEKRDLMSELRDLKAPGVSDDSDLQVDDSLELKQENKTQIVGTQTSEILRETPTLLDLDALLPPELPLLTPLSEDLLELPLLTDLQKETKTEVKQPSWTKNNLSSLVQAQFKKQLTSWDSSGIVNTRAKQAKNLEIQAQKLSAHILDTPGFKQMFFEKSDAELRDALADAVGQLKKNDPKFKKIKIGSYADLPKDKQAFVDAILRGLKAGLPKGIQQSSNVVNTLGIQKEVNAPQMLNKSELMSEIEKRRDQHLSPESLKKIEQLDKQRQAFDLDFAQDQIKTENQKLEQDTVGNRNKTPVTSTELTETELKDLMTQHFKPGQKKYSNEDILAAKDQAVKLIKNSTAQKLLWSVVLRPKQEMLDDLNFALYGDSILGPNDSQQDYSNELFTTLQTEALKKLEANGTVIKRGNSDVPQEIQFNGKSYTHQKQLGQGSFGVAHLFQSTNEKSGETEQIVVKQFQRGSDTDRWFGDMQQEIRAHHYAMGSDGKGHENVLALKGVLFDSKAEGLGEFFTVTEVAGKGSLKDVSNKIDKALENKQLSPTSHQLLKRSLLAKTMDGMQYIQSQRDMLHLDLKPDNIFVTAQGEIKIADFGTSSLKNELKSTDAIGTPVFMSPENMGKQSSHKDNPHGNTALNTGSDVWSLGVMARELLTGNLISINLQDRKDLDLEMLFDDGVQFSSDHKNRVYQKGSKEDRLGSEKIEVKKSEVKKSSFGALFKSKTKKKLAEPTKYEVKSLGAYEKVINAMMHPKQDQRPTLKALTEQGLFSDQILQEPKLQELLQAVLNNKDAKTIQKLSQEVESLNKRL
jgi:serine/threonine protein kinase